MIKNTKWVYKARFDHDCKAIAVLRNFLIDKKKFVEYRLKPFNTAF
jgi:hypothetical protein